jgi:hypothetical protein
MNRNPIGFYNDAVGYCTTGIGHLVDKVNKNGNQLDCASIDKLPPTHPIRKHKESVARIMTS